MLARHGTHRRARVAVDATPLTLRHGLEVGEDLGPVSNSSSRTSQVLELAQLSRSGRVVEPPRRPRLRPPALSTSTDARRRRRCRRPRVLDALHGHGHVAARRAIEPFSASRALGSSSMTLTGTSMPSGSMVFMEAGGTYCTLYGSPAGETSSSTPMRARVDLHQEYARAPSWACRASGYGPGPSVRALMS